METPEKFIHPLGLRVFSGSQIVTHDYERCTMTVEPQAREYGPKYRTVTELHYWDETGKTYGLDQWVEVIYNRKGLLYHEHFSVSPYDGLLITRKGFEE